MNNLTPGDPLGSGSNPPERKERPSGLSQQSPPGHGPGIPQPASPKRKLGWKAWVAIIVVGIAIIGALGGDDEPNDQASTTGAANEQAVDTATPEPTPEVTPEPAVQLRVAKPSSGATVRSPRVTVRGTVRPATARVKVDGKSVRVRNGKFARTVDLDVGRNIIAFEASANGFDRFEDSRDVTRRRSAAELEAIRVRREEAERARIAALTQTFSGNGSLSLGTISVKEESVLEWTNSNSDFPDLAQMLIYDKDFGISVSSDAGSGRTIVEAGRYRRVTVAGDDWTITIRPR